MTQPQALYQIGVVQLDNGQVGLGLPHQPQTQAEKMEWMRLLIRGLDAVSQLEPAGILLAGPTMPNGGVVR